jgi:AraC-like DNA-binding protein
MPFDKGVSLAIEIIRQQYQGSAFSLYKLAEQIGMSVWHLSRVFKKDTGMGFRQHLRMVRMKRAEELLQGTTLSIKEVAAAVGYNHISDFYHHFKAEHGVSPKEFRLRSVESK